MQNQSIEIATSKKETTRLTSIGLVFSITSLLVFINADMYGKEAGSLIPTLVQAFTICCFLFFTAITCYLFYMRNSSNAGLIIDSEGIDDHSNASSIGRIKWEDIIDIRAQTKFPGQFLMISVKNPKVYLEEATTTQKILLKMNSIFYKTPFGITLNTLDMDAETTVNLVEEAYRKSKFGN